MNLALAALGFGVVSAAVLSLAAVGLTLQFGVTNILNLAFASQMTVCALIAWSVNRAGVGIWVAVLIAGICGAVGSWALNRFLYTPFLHRRGTTFFSSVVITLAMLLILQYGAQAIWGPNPFYYSIGQPTPYRWGAFTLTQNDLITVGIAVVAMISVHVLLSYTRFGKAMRAVSSDPELAASSGIPVARVSDAAWLLTGVFAGVSGVTLAMSLGTFTTSLGSTYLLVIIAAAVLGGIGEPYGAMLGALVLGIATQESSLVLSSAYSELTAFAILIIVLLIRPGGLWSSVAQRRAVTA